MSNKEIWQQNNNKLENKYHQLEIMVCSPWRQRHLHRPASAIRRLIQARTDIPRQMVSHHPADYFTTIKQTNVSKPQWMYYALMDWTSITTYHMSVIHRTKTRENNTTCKPEREWPAVTLHMNNIRGIPHHGNSSIYQRFKIQAMS